jgi:hypothetical protein
MGPDRLYERLVEGKHMDQAFAERVAGYLITIKPIISVCTLACARRGKYSLFGASHHGFR